VQALLRFPRSEGLGVCEICSNPRALTAISTRITAAPPIWPPMLRQWRIPDPLPPESMPGPPPPIVKGFPPIFRALGCRKVTDHPVPSELQCPIWPLAPSRSPPQTRTHRSAPAEKVCSAKRSPAIWRGRIDQNSRQGLRAPSVSEPHPLHAPGHADEGCPAAGQATPLLPGTPNRLPTCIR